MTFGEKLKQIRIDLGLSQQAFADILKTSKQVISRYELGQTTPKISVAANWCKILGIDLNNMLNDEKGVYDTSSETKSLPAIPPGFEPLPKMVKKPLIGSIACGEPILAEENIEEYVDVPEDKQCDFCLRCKGDSMVEAGIRDNDVVYIHIQPQVENGQIAAVRIGGEATLKRVFWDEEQQILQLNPANSSMSPRVYSGQALEDIQIEGLAVGFMHWF